MTMHVLGTHDENTLAQAREVEMHKDDFHPHSAACIECQCYVIGRSLTD